MADEPVSAFRESFVRRLRRWDRRHRGWGVAGAFVAVLVLGTVSSVETSWMMYKLWRRAEEGNRMSEELRRRNEILRGLAASPEYGRLDARLGDALAQRADAHARLGDVFFQLRRWAQAEGEYTKAIELGALGPRHPALHYSRGVARAELRRWDAADEDFAGDIAQRQDTRSWFYHALLRLQLGDIAGYRDTCERMLDRWASSADFKTTDRLARACVLGPKAVHDLERLARLADRVVALDVANEEGRVLCGAVCYRAGRYQEARAYLEAAIEPMSASLQTKAWGNLYLAMTLDCLAHGDEARKCLDLAGRWIDREIPERYRETAGNPLLNWDERLLLPLLRREAEAQINKQPLDLPAIAFQEDAAAGQARSSANP
jgi:tetratricopeptide (TPR) repeat protein